MQRRLVLSGAILAALPTTGRGAVESKVDVVEAPDDVYVEQTPSNDGRVTSGATLFVLKSYRLEHMQNQLQAMEAHLDIAERPFHDGRVDNEIQLLKSRAASLSRAADIFQARFDDEQQAIANGSNHPHNLNTMVIQSIAYSDTHQSSQSSTNNGVTSASGRITSKSDALMPNPGFQYGDDGELALLQAKSDRDAANAALAEANQKKQDALDKIQVAKNKIAGQKALVAEQVSRLVVKAGIDGIFERKMHVGDFAKRGQILGTISIA